MDHRFERSSSLNGPLLPEREIRQNSASFEKQTHFRFPEHRRAAKSLLPADTEWYQGMYKIERERYSFIPQTTSTIRFEFLNTLVLVIDGLMDAFFISNRPKESTTKVLNIFD